MAIGACRVAEPVPGDLGAAAQAFFSVTCHTLEIGMHAFEGIVGQLRVVEGLDLEGSGGVAHITLAHRVRQSELSGVHVDVATGAFARRPSIGGPASSRSVARRGLVTTVAARVGVSSGERPRAVIDLGSIPALGGMAGGASALGHFCSELVAVRIVVTIGALPCLEPEVVPRALTSVTAATGHRLVFSFQGEISPRVLGHGERGRPEPVHVMTGGAVGRAELATVGVPMTVVALGILEATIAPSDGQLRQVAPIARDLGMHTFQRERRHGMGAKTDPTG